MHGRSAARPTGLTRPTCPTWKALLGALIASTAVDRAATAAVPPGCDVPVEALPADRAPLAVAELARPALGEFVTDTAHGTCIRRLTDHAASDAGRFAKTIYSRSQAFSADGSRVLVYFQNGTWHTVDPDTADDLGPVAGIVGAGAEPQWDATDPDLLYYLDDGGGPVLRRVNVRTGRIEPLADFTGRLGIAGAVAVTTGSSGSPSADQRWWAFVAEDAAGRSLGIVVWDRTRDRIVSRLNFAAAGLPATDTVSMSPGGTHVVAEWSAPTGVRAFPRDLSGPGAMLNTKAEHSDLARLPDGRDAYVSIDFDVTGQIYYVDLDAALAELDRFGAGRVELFSGYPGGSIHSLHFSGKAFDRPGWVLVSTYNPRRLPAGTAPWLYARLVAVELAPGGRTLGIAHDRVRPLRPNEGKVYFAEPHASVNRDFTTVAWNSNWEAPDALDVDVYAVDGIDWGDAAGSAPCPAAAARRTVAPDRWALLGLPCRVLPGTSVAALFGDDLDGEPGTDWALFRFDAGSGEYVEAGGSDAAPSPGEGFWFIHTGDGPRTLTLPPGSVRTPAADEGGACADAAGCAGVALAGRTSPTRWSLVASPVDASVPVRDLRVATTAGPCAAEGGCTLAQANGGAAGTLAAPPFRRDVERAGGGYVELGAGDVLDPWDGLWVASGTAARGRSPTLRIPLGR